jgi:hypothetical protein
MFGGADDETIWDVAAQSPAVGVANMGDPALDAGVQLGEADFARMIGGEPRPQRQWTLRTSRTESERLVGNTMKPSQGMPSSTGSTCARLGQTGPVASRSGINSARIMCSKAAYGAPTIVRTFFWFKRKPLTGLRVAIRLT